ncbi:MAG: hypothetical protein R3324_14905, partial [Halobacteriales archaeon]|nr:hypothetical protein [Halobacteriales archaeon]
MTDEERNRVFGDAPEPSRADYTKAATSDLPVLPLLPFAATYDLDVVLMSEHPDWEMHEYARLQTPDGPVWIAKDTRASDGDQLIVADLEDLQSWLPEIPLARKQSPLEVDDRSTEQQLDLRIGYENHAGEAVEVRYEGPLPTTPQSKRNGSTMGHSRHQVLAVLDLPVQDFGDEASLTIGGEEHDIEKIAGVKPMRLALEQTQAGLAETNFSTEPVDDGRGVDCPGTPRFRTVHHKEDDVRIPMVWTIEKNDVGLTVRQCSSLRTLGYEFLADDGSLELYELWVHEWNQDEPS